MEIHRRCVARFARAMMVVFHAGITSAGPEGSTSTVLSSGWGVISQHRRGKVDGVDFDMVAQFQSSRKLIWVCWTEGP